MPCEPPNRAIDDGPLSALSILLDGSGPAIFPGEEPPDGGDLEELLAFRRALRRRRPDDPSRALGVADALLRLGRSKEAFELAAQVERSGKGCPCCVEDVLVAALEALGHDPRVYPWSHGGPRFVALDRESLDRCYRYLRGEGNFRSAVEVLFEVFCGERLTFDHRELIEAMRADGRFHVRPDGQVEAKRRSRRKPPVC